MPVLMVDSAVAATALVQSGLTLWDDVVAWAGGAPAVWGRYMGDGYGAATPLTAAEADFLVNGKRCGILPIYNMATAESVAGGYSAGQASASAALSMARSIGVPAGVYLACDIEAGWPLSSGWIQGWADVIRGSEYAGSGVLYGALNSPAFSQALLGALSDASVQRLLLWAATPLLGPSTASNMPAWAPAPPSPQTAPMVHIWQYAESAYGGVVDLDEIDEGLLRPGIWAPQWWG